MAFRGTGLQVVKTDAQAQAPNVIDVERGAGAAWGQIAATGEKLASEAFASIAKDVHQADLAWTAEFEVAHRAADSEARDRFHHDPQGYKAWAEGHINGSLSSVPPKHVPHARQFLSRQTDRSYDAINSETRARDHSNGVKSLVANLTMTENDIMSDAAAGRTSEGKLLEYENKLRAGVASNFITAQEAELRIETVKDQAIASRVTREIRDTYQDAISKADPDAKATAIDAARRLIKDNPNLKIKESKRDSYYNKAVAEIRALEGVRNNDLREVRRAAAELSSTFDKIQIGPEQVNLLYNELMSLGDPARAVQLKADWIRAERVRAVFDPRTSLSEATDIAARYAGLASAPPVVQDAIRGAAQTTGVPLDYLERTAARESSFNPNARAGTSSATGLFQFTDATWASTLAQHGAKYGLGPNTSRFDPRANALMAGEFAKDNKRSLEAELGRSVSWGEVYVAHFAGADGARRLLSAPPNASAASILPAAAGANRTVFYNSDGSPKTVAQTVAGLSRGFVKTGGAEVDPDFVVDPRNAAKVNEALRKRVDEDWKKIEAQLKEGVAPTAAVLNEFMHAAEVAKDDRYLTMMQRKFETAGRLSEATQLPMDELRQREAAMRQRASEQGLEYGDFAFLQDWKTAVAKETQARRENPVGSVMRAFPDRYKIPPAIDWKNPEAAIAGLAYRQTAARHAATRDNLGTISPLDDHEVDSLKSRWDVATTEEKAGMLGAMTRGLDGRHLSKLLSKVNVKDPVMAAAGGLYTVDQEVAVGVIRGKASIAADNRFDPESGEGAKKNWLDELDRRIPIAAFHPEGRADADGPVASIRDAIRYRYADLAARASDTSGTLNKDRMDKAVRDVTGGTVTFNGQAVIAPRRGMDQKAFDSLVAGVTDDNMRGASTISGQPITADYLKRHARLVAYKDGMYLIQTNRDNAAPTYAMTVTGLEAPSTFVLDMRRVTPTKDEAMSDVDRQRLSGAGSYDAP